MTSFKIGCCKDLRETSFPGGAFRQQVGFPVKVSVSATQSTWERTCTRPCLVWNARTWRVEWNRFRDLPPVFRETTTIFANKALSSLSEKNNTANNIQAISKRTSNSAKTIQEKNKPSISKILPVNDGVIISRNSLSDLLSYSSNHE